MVRKMGSALSGRTICAHRHKEQSHEVSHRTHSRTADWCGNAVKEVSLQVEGRR